MKWILQEIFAMVAGLILGVTGGYLVYRAKYTRLRNKSRLQQIDSFHKEVRLLLWEATRETQASNALLLHMHNGGPRMAAGMRQYSSVVDEAPKNPALSSMVDWQSVMVDAEYREFMRRLQERQSIRLVTDEMPDSALRRRYEAMEITASIVLWCYETEGGPYYLSFPCQCRDPLSFVGGPDFARLESFSQRMRNTLKKYEQLGVLH